MATTLLKELKSSILLHWLLGARMGEERNAYGILVGKSGGKRPLGRPTLRWVDNIEINLKDIEWGGMD
jgi:hypothetical protein